ncbi:MAG: D-arabinono-1,4-lactone oxidase [Parvibaculum sp.]|nr:D-arabinono-1,4-lactone oxidase [Parvibaculum sp.]
MSNVWSNWSGWVKSWPQAIVKPASEDELCRAMRDAVGPVRVVGSGHSFTPLVESQGTIFDLAQMSGVIDHDNEAKTARIKAGTTIRDLGPLLFDRGMGLANQGDIDRQTIAGAVGTGTHGTGIDLGSISSAVQGFRLVKSDGEVLSASATENPDLFKAGCVSMGSLGIMSEITMKALPVYALEETGGRMQVDEALAQVETLRDAHRHFEFFWFPFADDVIVKFLSETDKEARPRRRKDDGVESKDDKTFRTLCEVSRYLPFLRGPIQKYMTSSSSRYSLSTDAPGRVRWSHDAFPSDRNNRFNEMEYAVPAEVGPDCLREVAVHMKTCGVNFLFPLEYRYVAADDIWISPFYQRDSVTISVHQYHRQPYADLFAGVEKIFRRYEGRPHWGKLHTMKAADFATMYPRWDDFCKLRRELDPQAKMLNPYLKGIFGVV